MLFNIAIDAVLRKWESQMQAEGYLTGSNGAQADGTFYVNDGRIGSHDPKCL